MKVSMKDLPELLRRSLKAGVTPMVHGSPGLGKSDVIRQLADKYSLKVLDFRLSQAEPTDMSGLPFIKGKGTKCAYIPMDTFPIEGDEIPEGYNGWLLLLDEITSAPPSTVAAAYKLILDRMVGLHKLHPQVSIIAAGNMATDRAIVHSMGTAMQSRLAHFEVSVHNPAWLEWAEENDIDHRIMAYIRFRPDMLHKFDPNHNQYTFPCPRTWDFASNLIKDASDTDIGSMVNTDLVCSVIGEGAGREFVNFCEIYKKLPTYSQILKDPENIEYVSEPSVLYAITGLITHNVKKDDVDKIIKFTQRLPIEFAVIAHRGIIRKVPSAMQHKYITQWIIDNKQVFNG